ncbi:hypothetical protein L1987_10760 [Smallanthus sonchifolius]|uniref:Uncharacterized protein n=1 Tax=Smallanthus sonchifolius TaxID=185202 RepID=A0ACB9J9I6_9ASTR|nr:hypothetical protein L1987_10760 [Smallanthus sonchifolius]
MDQCLDAVGIGDTLRQKSTQMKGEGYESRCVRRKDLLETIVNELPLKTIRYSSKVATIDELGRFKLVLIGCDGVNSVVAKWLGLKTPVSVGRSAIRGLVDFPNGSGLDPMFYVKFGGGVRFGFLPVMTRPCTGFAHSPRLKFHLVSHSNVSSLNTESWDEEDWQVNPIKMKQFVLSSINKMPQEAQDVVERTELSSISYAPLKFRLPWNVLFDSVVLGRCLGEVFLKKTNEEDDEFERTKKGLEKYGKERRWRSFSLVSVAYCVGFMQQSKGMMMSLLRKVWFSSYTPSAFLKMANFDCGNLAC